MSKDRDKLDAEKQRDSFADINKKLEKVRKAKKEFLDITKDVEKKR